MIKESTDCIYLCAILDMTTGKVVSTYRCPCPLVSAHGINIQLRFPAQLLFSSLSRSIDGRGIAPPPRHNLVVHLLATGLLKSLQWSMLIMTFASIRLSFCCYWLGNAAGVQVCFPKAVPLLPNMY